MKAVVLSATGDADNLQVQEIETPHVTPGHVLVKVHACGVGYRDVIERRGGHPAIQTPIVQGHEFAGEICQVGEGVHRWKAGDRVVNLYYDTCGVCDNCLGGDERECSQIREVFGLTVNGGYAEYVLAAERPLELLPEGIPYDVAATLMSATGVGFHNTVNIANVRPGDSVLITGATGGVGSAALQTAKLYGAEVWAVTSSENKVGLLKGMGADHVILNSGGDFHRQILQERNGIGLDIAIDCVGAPTFNGSLRSLRQRGRAVIIGNVDGRPVELNLGIVVIRALHVIGSDNVTRIALRKAMELVRVGKIKPLIHERMPLDKAAVAHQILESKGAFGRSVLLPGTGA